MKRKMISVLVVAGLILGLAVMPAQAADPNDIEASIVEGLEWLVPQQNPDGSWYNDWGEPVAQTGFALVKLCDRAYETGYDPFEPDYIYSQNVIHGLDYLFGQASVAGVGICFATGSTENYSTGIAMMAIAATRKPLEVVNVGNPSVDGMTYKDVLQGCVDYMAWSQCDAPSPQRGGWSYGPNTGSADQSNTGYSVLGLRYAEADLYGFKCDIPPAVRPEHTLWVNYIQCLDGGSGYSSPLGSNLLRTGNLLFEQSFVGIAEGDARVQDALGYIQNNWPAGDLQSMYCLMKGLQSLGIDEIIVGGNPIDWFDEMSTVIVDNQHDNGSWEWGGWGTDLNTVFALLTLEKVGPPPPVDVVVEVSECACDVDGYDVTITYTVERFLVDGTLTVKKDGAVYDTVTLVDFTGTANETYNIASDTPGTHTWRADLDVTPVGGGTPAHADDEASVRVCETPVLGDIADQVMPFTPIDLDSHVTNPTVLPVGWSVSSVPAGWMVTIDANNMATVTSPEGANDPVTITFTASVECCVGVVCSDSDSAVFTPNRPPDCTAAYADPACLWPPNHKFVDVAIMGVTDPDGDPVTITITDITSDEATATDKGSGGAKHSPDADGIGTDTASVRAERSGTADGRVYVISFTASDGRGGECEGSVMVKVPHDQSDNTCPAVDSGQIYDATQMN